MKKLVFISSVAVPHQIKLCYALCEYFDAEFWFYESPDRTRGKWWRIDLGSRCKVLERVMFFKSGPWSGKYFASGLSTRLEEFNPDVVMLGGFSIPGNMLAFAWARRCGKATVVFTERSRDRYGKLRKRRLAWRFLRWFYRDVDLVVTSAEDVVEQLRDEFRFGDKVVAGRYAADLDAYFEHPVRQPRSAYTYLFANRLTPLYNPICALEVFARIRRQYPGSHLLMNAAGEQADACKAKIAELQISGAVEFLTDIACWSDLHKVYARSDILLLPADFSNGNFTVLEAMASGMGIVVSNRVLGIGKLVEDGVNGFNCEPNTEAFVGRVLRYINEPELLTRHATINRQLVMPLSIHGTARFLADVLKQRLNVGP